MTKTNITKLAAFVLISMASQNAIAARYATREVNPTEILNDLNNTCEDIKWSENNWKFMEKKFADILQKEYSPTTEKYAPAAAGMIVALLSFFGFGGLTLRRYRQRKSDAQIDELQNVAPSNQFQDNDGYYDSNKGDGDLRSSRLSVKLPRGAFLALGSIVAIIALPYIFYKGTKIVVDKTKLYKRVFSEFVTNWPENRKYTPEKLRPIFDSIHTDYLSSADKEEYLSLVAPEATKIIRKTIVESIPQEPAKPSLLWRTTTGTGSTFINLCVVTLGVWAGKFLANVDWD